MDDKEQRIRRRAYEVWERDGKPDNRAEEHWRQAELEEGSADASGGVEPEPSAPAPEATKRDGRPSSMQPRPDAKAGAAPR
jgi:hypothetical protein